MTILTTPRLLLRELTLEDAPFIVELLNDPAFLRFIGDKLVRTVDDARTHLTTGPLASYAKFGFGLWMTELRDGTAIGICGLVKRDTLPDVDVGFAFLPAYRARGYATESAAAAVAHGRDVLGIERIVGIANPDNSASIRVLTKLGMAFERAICLKEGEPAVHLFG